jgi:fibronectin-binding autotransporter adhesin
MGGAVEEVVDFAEDVVDDVGSFVQDEIIDPISDVGSDIDDFINEEIPGGWGTVAAVVIATTTGIPVEFGSATTAAEVVTVSEAAFVAADAAQLAAQGLSQAQIASTIAATGVSEAAAAAAAASATAAAGGSVASGIPVSAGGGLVEAPIAAEVTGAAGGTAGGTGLTAGGGGLGLTAPTTGTVAGTTAGTGTGLGTGLTTSGLGTLETVGGMEGLLGAGEALTGAGLGLTAPTAPGLAGMGGGQGLLTQAAGGGTLGAGGVVSPTFGADILGTTSNGLSIDSLGRAFNQAGQLVRQFTSSEVGQLLGSAAQAVVSNNAAEANAAALRNLGSQAAQQAATIGAAANVPFTPYTVTSGLGTSTISPTGATTTAAGPYAALQQQALGLSGAALGAINPAQASQTLFGQLEGLQGPARQREQEALLSRLGARGLLGIGQNLPTMGGGTGLVNPYMESLLSAQATQQAQNALAAQQFGTQEAARQQAIAQALQSQGLQVDQQTLQQLQLAGQQGLGLQQLALTGAGRQAEAGLRGLGLQTQLNLGAADIDAARRQQIAQAVNQNIGNLGTSVGGALTGAGNLLSGASSLGNAVNGLFGSTYTPSVYEANMGVNFLAPGIYG